MKTEIKEEKTQPKGRGKKPFKKGATSKRPYHEEVKPYVGPNDIKWRAGDDVLTSSAATLPFGYPLGLPIETGVGDLAVPGIMVVYTQPTVGSASNYNSPANLAFRMIYQINRRYNSGSKNYDISNLGLVMCAMVNAIACAGWLQRIYWTITDFSQLSRFKPKALIEVQNVNYTDVAQHQAELAYLISWLGNAIKSIALPDLPIFHAAYQAYSNYYLDDDAGKHQVYLLAPYGFGFYDPADNAVKYNADDGWTLFGKTAQTYSDIYTNVHAMMDVLLSDQDVGLIVGDTAKAWGDRIFQLEALTAEECSTPKREIEFLQQIHNLQLSPVCLTDYHEIDGTASSGPYIVGTYNTSTTVGTTQVSVAKCRVDAYSNEPDPKEVINAFVLQCNFEGYTQAGSSLVLSDLYTGVVHNFHLPLAIKIQARVDGVATQSHNWVGMSGTVFSQARNNSYQPGTWSGTIDMMTMTNFDWHPLGLVYLQAGDIRAFGDTRNVCYFEKKIARNIHENCMLNLLGFTTYGVTNDVKK